jgi:peptidoglycan/xylan/chitin deacetylase (PgdA/CDA1 family)
MDFIPTKTPKFITKALPHLVWQLPTREKAIYLTFDDGPTSGITEWTLDTLHTYNAKATFFCIGNNIIKHPDIFQRIIEEGHTIGNHTYDHLKGWNTKTKDYIKNTLETQALIENYTLNTTKAPLFRPPHGRIKPKQAKQLHDLGFKIIMWNILSKDWNPNISETACLANVIENTTSGDIVVFHDSIKASKNMQYALPRVLDYFSKKGFEFKRIPA